MEKHEIVEEYLLNVNKIDYNIDKTIEEAVEVADVLLKYKNKEGDKKPTREQIAAEIADLAIRMHIVVENLDLEELVTQAFDAKMDKLLNYIEEGKYENI